MISPRGTPKELKKTTDEVHGMGRTVLFGIVHLNACKNVLDGIKEFDRPDHLYFHEEGKGCHELRDS